MNILARYLRLFAYFVAFSFSRSFEFRFDFYMRILMDIIYYLVAISFFKILFLHTPNLGGWNEAQMMIFVAGYCMVDAICMTFFANNTWQLGFLINRGDLDYYLVRPVSSLFFLSLRDFAANSFVNLIITFGMLAWFINAYPEHIAPWRIALFIVLIFNGAFIFYCLNMLANLPVFFTQSPQGFGNLIWSLNKFGERPDRIYQGKIKRFLTTVLPFCLIASYPTRLLIEDFEPMLLVHILVITVGLFCVLLFVWRFALRHYSSASS